VSAKPLIHSSVATIQRVQIETQIMENAHLVITHWFSVLLLWVFVSWSGGLKRGMASKISRP